MRCSLAVAVLAAAVVCTATAAKFKDPLAQVFSTWDLDREPQYVDSFDHLALKVARQEVHEEEHTRKKRNAADRAIFAAMPITKACERPGYTGQYCEFPICREENPSLDQDQYETDTGFYVDMTVHANCTRKHYILIDDMLADIRIKMQADKEIRPVFDLFDAQGNFQEPYKYEHDNFSCDATYMNLVPGMYEMVPQANTLSAHCFTVATGHTHLTFSGGFTMDERERNDFPHEFAVAHHFNSIIVHANNLRSPGELKSIQVIGPNNFIFRPRLLEKRFGCTYEYYFDSFFCYESGSYSMILEGVDFKGNLFRRAAPFQCADGPNQSTAMPVSTTPAPSPTGCANGGILLQRADNSTYCVCQDHFIGYDCSIPICINGGRPFHDPDTNDDHCYCPEGFHGLSCESVTCDPKSGHGFGTDMPELLFVVRTRQQMNDVVQQVSAAINLTVANTQFDPGYFYRFHLILFNNDTIVFNDKFSGVSKLLDKLNSFVNSADTSGGCTDTVFGSIATSLLNTAITNKAVMYVITDALADDFEEYAETIFQWNSYWKATINFFFIEPAAATGCATDISDPGFRSFRNLASRYNGLAWHIKDRSQVYYTLFTHMENLLYRTQLMLSLDRQQCSRGLYKTVQVEKKNERLIIVASGQNTFPFLTNPMGVQVVDDDLEELISPHDNNYGMWRLKNLLIGQYVIKPASNPSSSGCSFRVYQGAYKTSGNIPQPDLFWSISNDVDKDGNYLMQPVFGEDNHPVFHLTGYEEPEIDRVFSALTMYTERDGVEIMTYASNGIYRRGCDFNFFFPAMQCRVPGELIHFEFFVRDTLGYYIQRAGAMVCANNAPTMQPPSECLNGGVESSNGTCLCLPHYYGKRCQNIQCENGGTQQGEKCSCSAGWTGNFCEHPRCVTAGPSPSYGYGVDMAFIIELTTRGQEQIKQLASVLPEILRDVRSQHRGWVERFVLVAYNGTWSDVLVDAPADSYGKVVTRLQEIANSTITDNSCIVRPWSALRKLLRGRQFGNDFRGIPRRSVINIYETGLPDEFDAGEESADLSEEIITRFLIVNVFQGKNPDGNGTDWFCNPHEGVFNRLENAARRGDGRFYTILSSDVSKSAYFIPSLFSSSIVYKSYFDNCESPQNVFFPVDAYTQTVTAIVQGHKSNLSLTYFTGQPVQDKFRVPIFQDENNAITEFRNPCDDSWQDIQQYCVNYNTAATKLNYTQASDYCKNERAFLLDDQSDTKNAWIKSVVSNQAVWLGLQYLNNKWVFQHDDGTTSDATQNYWQGGVSPNVSQGLKCAYFDPTSTNGYWVGTTCDKTYTPVCQKHRYDRDNTPSKIGEDDVSPGKYILTVQTDGATKDGWKGCSVEVKVQSDINIEWGIVNDMRNDEPMGTMNVDSDKNIVVATISQGRSKTREASVKHVQIRSDDKNSLLLEAAVYQSRIGCNYEYYSQPLLCSLTNGSDVSVVHIGEDSSGNTFQRYTTSYCAKWIGECFNYGIYSNGACVCSEYFQGDRCQTPICQNGGTLSENRCHCAAGFGGDACQFNACPSPSKVTFSNDNRRLVLLVEASTNTKTALANLAASLPAVVQAAQANHPNWFKTFIIHSFNPDGTSDRLAVYSDITYAAEHLQDISDASTQTGNCQMRLFEAMNDMFTANAPSVDGAEVLLLTSATPVDHDDDNMFHAMRKFSTFSPIVDYIRIDSDACPISGAANNLTKFVNFISSTNGLFFRVSQADIVNGLTNFLPSRYAPQRFTYSYPNGFNNDVFHVMVDVNTTDVYISVSGNLTNVIVTEPKGNGSDVKTLYRTGVMGLYQFTPAMPGIFKVQTWSADNVCFPAVYGTGGVQVVVGFIQDLASRDDPSPFAVRGSFNYPVFHLIDPDDSRIDRGFLYHTNFVRHTVSGHDDAPYKSDVSPRINCAYNYIGRRFRCDEDEDETITLSVSGADTYRQNFMRQSTTWCKGSGGSTTASTPASTTTPLVSTGTPVTGSTSTLVTVTATVPTIPTTTTVTVPTSTVTVPPTTTRPLTPKDIQFDVLFLIDETETDGFQNFTGIPFVLNLMSIYTVDQARARVGIITIPNNADSTMPVTFLNAINSYDALVQNLYQINDFVDNDDDPTEIRLTRALQYSHGRFMFPANGYRSTTNNHLIVMLTETSTVLDKQLAIDEAAAILTERSFGIISVGYGAKTNMNDLSPFAGTDCTFIAPDWNTLSTSVTQAIQAKIWSAYNQTQGQYCGVPNN